MTKKIIQIRQNENVFQLTWIINNICTNHCDYCPPSLHSGTNHHYEWANAKTFINRLLDRYRKIHVTISGGEPTVSPFFPGLVSMFYDRGHTVGITTNGARNVRYWEEIAPKLSYICFSWHPSHEDPDFLEKVLAASKHTHCTIRVMMHDTYFERSKEMFEKLSQYPQFRTEAVRILTELAGRQMGNNYTAEQEEWLTNTKPTNTTDFQYLNNPGYRVAKIGSSFYYDNGETAPKGDTNYLISTKQTDFRGWACNIGLESMFILYDGWVKKGNCDQGGYMFHINNHQEHELPTMGELCVQNICHCGTDVLISKVPVLGPDHPYITENLTGMRTSATNEDFIRRNRKYIKINNESNTP